jgi:hypothetical protein
MSGCISGWIAGLSVIGDLEMALLASVARVALIADRIAQAIANEKSRRRWHAGIDAKQ